MDTTWFKKVEEVRRALPSISNRFLYALTALQLAALTTLAELLPDSARTMLLSVDPNCIEILSKIAEMLEVELLLTIIQAGRDKLELSWNELNRLSEEDDTDLIKQQIRKTYGKEREIQEDEGSSRISSDGRDQAPNELSPAMQGAYTEDTSGDGGP